MKNLFASFLFVLAVAAAHLAQAQTIRRVNNTGLTIAGVNIYSTLQAAHDASSAGDIIYLEPSDISYGNLLCVRPLTIIGNGYYLNQNPTLQLDKRESVTGSVTFAAGSTGSRITGCYINGFCSIAASSITVERNRINSTVYIGYNATSGAYATLNTAIVRQNYITSTVAFYTNGATTVSNVSLNNNILASASISTSGSYAGLGNILISNNVIGDLAGNSGYGIDIDNAVIKNNILTYTSGTGSNFTPRNNAYSYNISGNAAFGTANGNQSGVAPSSIFVGGTASTDGAFQLRTGSPALGTGESGTDVGAFGGTLPYRIAGIPNVPSIYQFNQAVSGNSLNATISTRSNN
ncbi:hypothetical protein ACFST9_20020 [Hymenobacter monticola]|uniref:Right-handed parallel beta-helix repeat-containing protein n=1 Tax=Hymenobacter monticola TaxID=1705399 RepID=A0ABY4B8H8_9BACT|nr:hypothetical protein [Hymenobacter monticola]UOE34607.1 hypothetical protein MTP16_02890 [Hymenobacter monticola]